MDYIITPARLLGRHCYCVMDPTHLAPVNTLMVECISTCGLPVASHNLLVYMHAQAQLDEQRAGLQTLVAARRSKLEESIKLHQYLQEVEEVHSWIGEKQAIAGSDDYGKDFDHLLVRICCRDYWYFCEISNSIYSGTSLKGHSEIRTPLY